MNKFLFQNFSNSEIKKFNKTRLLFTILLFLIPSAVMAGEIVVTDADSVWTLDLITAPPDAIDSTDAPTENLITWAFVSHADSVWSTELTGNEWKAPEKWSFALITDLHIGYDIPDYDGMTYNDGQPPEENYYLAERLKKIIERVNELKETYNIKFVSVLGDVSDTAEYSELLKARDILNNLEIPYIPLIGNHDVWPYTQKEGIDPDVRGKDNQATIADSAIGDEYFEGIFWCSFDTLAETREECLTKNTNPQKIKEVFGDSWKRQEDLTEYKGSPYLQNYAFSYKGINFLSLDHVQTARESKPGYLWEGKEYLKISGDWFNNNLKEPTIVFSHHPSRQWKFFGLPAEVYSSFSGHWHERKEDDNKRLVSFYGSVITEALLEEYENVIRIVQVKDTENPKKEDIDYSVIKGIPKDKVSNDIKRPDPYINFFPENPDFDTNLTFTIRDEIKGEQISSCNWNFGDGTSANSSSKNCEISHKYTSGFVILCEDFKVKATVKYQDDTERLTKEKTIRVCPKFELKLPIPIIPFSIFGEEITLENTLQSTFLEKVSSEGKPIAIINIHFEEATEDIDLTNLVADINLETRKSVLYISEWPKVIEEEKVLFIPSTSIGTIYLCPHATSLAEVNPQCEDIQIFDVGESKNGIFVETTVYNGREYYIVYGVKGTGGGEAQRTQLTYQGDLSGQYSDEVNLKATLTTKDGQPLLGKTINFILGEQSTTAITDENGIATTIMELWQIPDEYTSEVKFAGEKDYLPSSDSKLFEILKENTVLSKSVGTIVYSDESTIQVSLYDDDGQTLFHQKDLPKTVYLEYFGEAEWKIICQDVLESEDNSDATLNCYFEIPTNLDEPAGDYKLRTRFDGDTYYNSSESFGTLTILKETLVITVTNKEGFYDDTVTLETTVLDDDGETLLHGPYEVEFKVNGKVIGKSSIGERGEVKVDWKIDFIPQELTETYPITVIFADNECYNSAEGNANFTLKSAKWLKQDAISELKTAKTGNEKIGRKIDLIIKHIQNSLDNDLWIDSSHLIFFKRDNCFDSGIFKLDPDKMNLEKIFEFEPEKMESEMKGVFKGECFAPKLGIRVFHEEYIATKLMLIELEGKPQIPEELKNVFKEVIAKLVKADTLLAKVSLYDAKNTPVQNPKFQKIVEFQIKKAEEELIKAEKELEKVRPDKAILRFAKSWLHSQLAIKFANLKEQDKSHVF